MNLPFLKPKGWPSLRKYAGESRYGFSEDDELVEGALDELMAAYGSKDPSKFREALTALIDCIMSREESEDAPVHEPA